MQRHWCGANCFEYDELLDTIRRQRQEMRDECDAELKRLRRKLASDELAYQHVAECLDVARAEIERLRLALTPLERGSKEYWDLLDQRIQFTALDKDGVEWGYAEQPEVEQNTWFSDSDWYPLSHIVISGRDAVPWEESLLERPDNWGEPADKAADAAERNE